MDIIRDLIQTSNASRLKVRIVNNNGIFGVVATNETTPTLPTEIAAPSAIPTAISVAGATSGTIGTTERVISFPYSGTAATKDYTFTTTENLVCDILVVGGGGAGGKRHGGGGGAGTLLYHKNITLNGTYNIKVGKGGTGVPSTGFASGNTVLATSGNFSQFIKSDSSQEYYANGGGRGGGWSANSLAITNGGRTYSDSDTTLPLTNKFNGATVSVVNKNYVNTLTSPEGCRGNIGGLQVTNYKGGGGGGAGGVGMNHDAETTVNDGYGGLGLAVDITGTSVVYAGGGNGSDFSGSVSQVFDPSYPTIQSRGGGGFGSDTGTGQNGLDGTGGGGGGQGNDADGFPSGNGGSGIVIIRYRKPSSEIVVSSTIAGTTDRYISFPYSGTAATKDYTITTTEALSCDILIVGGGGCGGTYIGGGGGAGGVLYIQNATIPIGTYNILVGRGGLGVSGTTAPTTSQNGISSKAFGIEVFGGGYGGIGEWGNASGRNGASGGSGGAGGSAYSANSAGVGGSITQPSFTNSVITVNTYNYYGGSGATSMIYNGNAGIAVGANGGGGAGGNAPANTDQANAGAGADGIAINITGVSYFWGGGGGGGQYAGTKAGNGGKGGGGGGNGSQVSEGVGIGGIGGITLGQDGDLEGDGIPTAGNGGAGTGGGGGGTGRTTGSPNAISGSGGSGIVIIRYRKATNTISNTLFSISNGGVISTSTNVYSNVIINYVDSSNVSSGTSSTGISSQWTTVSGGSITNIYYNTSNVGIGTLDPVAPLHIYNNTITPLPTAISVIGATSGTIGTTERVISFPYTSDSVGLTGQTQYTFTTTENLICDILIVGGGGSGGTGHGGGGGAGALIYLTNQNLSSGAYTIKVGNGGAAVASRGITANNGQPSSILFNSSTIYLAIGGGGGGGAIVAGANGGSGGGGDAAAGGTALSTNTPSGTYGFAGGTGANGYTNDQFWSGGGGGGAGAVGGNAVGATTTFAGNGGIGREINIIGTATYYAGGGGGGVIGNTTGGNITNIGSGGSGGGGNGGKTSVGVSGLPNTGGGGGGGGFNGVGSSGDFSGGAGGSGIIIIRYRLPTVVSNARLLLDTTTTGTPSIEFRRGVGADMQNDYRLINDTSPANGTIKLLCENSTQSFNDTTANLAWFSSNETIIHKNTSMNGRVGIGTVYHATNATRSLDVLGDANISGAVSVGGLSISGNSSSGVTAIISNSLTSNTSLTIRNGMIPPSITSSPVATTTGTIGAFTYQVFTYTTETAGAGTGQSLYTLTVGAGGAVCDVLVVGGGGAGGAFGGGGGAGQVLYGTNVFINSGTVNINVGNGGATTTGLNVSQNGFSSSITIGGITYSSVGGGGGGGRNSANFSVIVNGNNGGSGGGGNTPDGSSGAIGGVGGSSTKTSYSGWISYGNSGGYGIIYDSTIGCHLGGGGGGAGGSGGSAVLPRTSGSYGGIGVDFSSIFGTSVGESGWFGGGGGGVIYGTGSGGLGGTGGGGKGAQWSPNTPNGVGGTVNTGGGGGGGGLTSGYGYGTGGKGGSGIIIIRYLTSTSTSINLVRGTVGDANRDYKIGNYNAEFKVLSSVSNTDTDYIKITTAGAITNPTGTASWNTGSDRRIKENIERASYDKCFDNINRLELNRFNYIDGFNTVSRDRAQLGFIAQEVKDIFPKSISTQGYYSDSLNIPDLLSIDISQINYSLYGAVKKLIELNKEDKEKLASLDNRIKTITNFLNISLDASDIVIDSSNIAIDSSNIAIDTSNLLDTSNITIDTSNLLDTSNITIDTSNLLDTSNITIDTSNLLDTSNITIDTSNLLDTSNITIDTSNLLDTSNITIDTSNLIETSNISIDTSNLLDTSNITIDTSNLLDTSNITIDTSNLIETSNITIDTSNLLDTSNISTD